MKVQVHVYSSLASFEDEWGPMRSYTMDHDDPSQRRVLGEQCRNAFEAGQVVLTYPV
jgi:hypothetical protein